jgi:[histone H3]-lysine9 N-trimethyltransferase SUV39H
VNTVDDEGPPDDFKFIEQYDFTKGTNDTDPNALYGCECLHDNDGDIGCENESCECLADCGTDEDGQPLGFPYATNGDKEGCLLPKYLDHRHVVYECNKLCSCGDQCKNKVVQRGRTVKLEIFKTEARGWGEPLVFHVTDETNLCLGLRCLDDLREGQFLDVYLGEVISDGEAKRRETISTIRKDSYLFSLDKFYKQNESQESNVHMYVVDGEKRGSVARFINHCCDPNLRVFAVKYDRGDPRIYQLAFFAAEDIPAGTELTFDYLDRDEEESDAEELSGIGSRKIGGRKKNEEMAQCHCGAPNCRQWLWI